jgi:hypothetical protein
MPVRQRVCDERTKHACGGREEQYGDRDAP